MEKTLFFEAKFDKLNGNCFFFDVSNETENLVGKTIKFLNFELITGQISNNENKNTNPEKSIRNLSIKLYTPKDVIDNSSKVLAEIYLNKGEKDSQIIQTYNNFTNISKECYLKLEEKNSDKPEHLLSSESKCSIKITYENFNNKHNSNSNLNNIQTVIKTASDSKNYFDQLQDNNSEEDEEDEDYEESQSDSIENSLNSDESEDLKDDFVKSKSNTLQVLAKENLDYEDEEDHANFVQDLFEEAEDINRDLLYLTDEESDNYLHLICEDVAHDDKYNTNQNNNIDPIPGKKRYMLRRKRKPNN